jgi:hypothetical protein
MTKRNKIIICLFIAVIILVIWFVVKPTLRGWQFCTPQDEVYQAIEMNVSSWQSYFSNMNKGDPPVLRFSVSGKEYVVFTSPGNINDASVLFVPTLPEIQEVLGYNGYIYSSSSQPLQDKRYEVTNLAGNVYCYRFK